MKLFNTHHSEIRNVIECIFGVLKKIFAFLRGPVPNFYMSTQVGIVIVCCALHNLIRMNQPMTSTFNSTSKRMLHWRMKMEDPQWQTFSH